jgi:hypothetical protein
VKDPDRDQRVRDETGAALDAYLRQVASRRPRAAGWQLWAGPVLGVIGMAGSVTAVTGYHHHVVWALISGVALMAAACWLSGYWTRALLP